MTRRRYRQRNSPARPAFPLRPPRGAMHYGWVIAFLGMATVFASLGIARFSLGMLLPSMRADLHLSYTAMGWISTGNFIGYLVAAVGCGRLVASFGARAVVFGGLITIVASLVVVALGGGLSVIFPAYLVTGLGSGVANVAVMGLVPHWFTRRLRGRAAGIMVVGSGFALMMSGLLVPVLTARWGAGGWRAGWICLAAVVLIVAVAVGLLLRNSPREMQLAPHGHEPGGQVTTSAHGEDGSHRRTLTHLGGIYFLFGFSYVVYVTFIVTTMVQRGFSERAAGRFWFAVGLLSILSGPVFGAVSDRAGRRIGLAAVFALHGLSYLLVGLAALPVAAIYASVTLFGIAAWSIPGIMAAAVGDYMGPAQAVTAFGRLTVAFGAGQVVGPVVAGALAEATGAFAAAFVLTAVLSGGGLVLSLALRPPPARPASAQA